MSLFLLEGPAGGGKSALAASMLSAGEISVLGDITSIWAALSGAQRGPDGRYPVRLDDDPALRVAQYVQRAAIRRALRDGIDAAATTSQAGQAEAWRELAEEVETEFILRTVDPGRRVVEARLADAATGILSDACRAAISRWYG